MVKEVEIRTFLYVRLCLSVLSVLMGLDIALTYWAHYERNVPEMNWLLLYLGGDSYFLLVSFVLKLVSVLILFILSRKISGRYFSLCVLVTYIYFCVACFTLFNLVFYN